MSRWLDELTETFAVDQAFSGLLVGPAHASKIAELIVWDEWRNNHLGSYLGFLPSLAQKRFKRDVVDLASMHSGRLIKSSGRDLSLTLYMAVRGLPFDGLFFVRRALEHLAVLTHVWKHTNRIQTLDEPGD